MIVKYANSMLDLSKASGPICLPDPLPYYSLGLPTNKQADRNFVWETLILVGNKHNCQELDSLLMFKTTTLFQVVVWVLKYNQTCHILITCPLIDFLYCRHYKNFKLSKALIM